MGHIWIGVGKNPCWETSVSTLTHSCDMKGCSTVHCSGKKMKKTIKSKTDQGGDWSHATARNRVRDAKEGSREVGSQINVAGGECLFIANILTWFWRFVNTFKRPFRGLSGTQGFNVSLTWPSAMYYLAICPADRAPLNHMPSTWGKEKKVQSSLAISGRKREISSSAEPCLARLIHRFIGMV